MTELPPTRRHRTHIVVWISLAIVLATLTTVVLNREWLYNWYRGISYRPTEEMAQIRNALELTSRGEFLFNAVQPVLNESTEFNKNCRKDESNLAILGCYTEDNIYIYNIVEPDLDGIRELTAAHELLHAAWNRMSEDERQKLSDGLKQVLSQNQELSDELAAYNANEQQEELYVRAGTEVKVLPATLETHYAEFFGDQDHIVDFYNQYIAVFRAIKSEMSTLLSDMEMLKTEINAKTTTYQDQFSQLEADITSFNSCAAVAGCFKNTSEFNSQRAALTARQSSLENLNNEINTLIDTYNAKVDIYNSDVTESHKLQDIINSNSTIESTY